MNGAAYYNEIDPFCCEWLRNLIAAGQLPPGEVDGRDIRDVQPEELDGFTDCHFFAGIGGWPLALRLAGYEGGVDASGPQAARANPSALLRSHMAERKASAMSVIYGRISTGSSPSAALQQSLANKFLARFHGDGGIERPWTLKPRTTPARRLYCQLVPSALTTKEKGFYGVPTPAARDGRDISRSTIFLSQRKRHSPSLAIVFLERGGSWMAITAAYCLTMGYPLPWNEARPRATATRSSPKSLPPLLKP